MGAIASQSRSDRFIGEFNDDLVANNGLETDVVYKVASQHLGYDEGYQVVRQYALLNPTDLSNDNEVVVTIGGDEIYFDPHEARAEDGIERVSTMLRRVGIGEAELNDLTNATAERLKRIEVL